MTLDYPDPELATSRVRLRKWTYADLPCVEAASSDPEIPRGTTVPVHYTDELGREWIERQWSRQTSGQGVSMAIAEGEDGVALGIIYLADRQPAGNCELGYWLIPAARGRGTATEAVRLASQWVLGLSGIHRLFALVVPTNEASQSVLIKCGFTREGILRSYLPQGDVALDVISYSLLDSDIR